MHVRAPRDAKRVHAPYMCIKRCTELRSSSHAGRCTARARRAEARTGVLMHRRLDLLGQRINVWQPLGIAALLRLGTRHLEALLELHRRVGAHLVRRQRRRLGRRRRRRRRLLPALGRSRRGFALARGGLPLQGACMVRLLW